VVNATPPATLPPGMTQYPSYRRLGRPQGGLDYTRHKGFCFKINRKITRTEIFLFNVLLKMLGHIAEIRIFLIMKSE
jgi:hypothetical protein